MASIARISSHTLATCSQAYTPSLPSPSRTPPLPSPSAFKAHEPVGRPRRSSCPGDVLATSVPTLTTKSTAKIRRSCIGVEGPPWQSEKRSRASVRAAGGDNIRVRSSSPIPRPKKSSVPHALLPRTLLTQQEEVVLTQQEGGEKLDELDEERLAKFKLESWLKEQQEPPFEDNEQVKRAFEEWLQNRTESHQHDRPDAHSAKQKKPNFFSNLSPRVRGLALLNVLTFLYGSNIPVVKGVGSVLDPASFSAGRFGIAALAFSPFLWGALKDKNTRQAGLELGVWASFAYLLQAVGLATSEAGRASFFSTFTVILVPLLAGLLGAKIPWLTWASAAAALAGVFLLESSGAPPCIGDLWTFASACIFGIHMLRSEHHARSLHRGKAINLISLQMTVIASMSALWAAYANHSSGHVSWLGEAFAGDWEAAGASLAAIPWVPMLYTGLLSTALCLWIEIVSLKDVTAVEAAVVYTLEPLWGAGFAWSMLGERWGSTGWVGAALILSGSLATQLFGKVHSGHGEEGHKEERRERDLSLDGEEDGLARARALLALAEIEEQKLMDNFGETEEVDNFGKAEHVDDAHSGLRRRAKR